MAVLRQMRIVCGMRLHSIVFSAAACAPCMAVSYDIKVSGFMRYIGLADRCQPLSSVTEDWLCRQIDELMQGQDLEAAQAIRDKLVDLEMENRRAAAQLLGLEGRSSGGEER